MAKTYKSLYPQMYSFETLYAAYERARRGKRYRPEVLAFTARLGENLLAIQAELQSLTWQPGDYRERVVHDPKRRIIRIAPFRDRIVHQALCQVVAPLFEETFIHDSYACRVGKGSHAAVDRLTAFLHRRDSRYVLKGDLSKFFDSIPHGLVMRELEWRIADGFILELCRRVLTSYASGFIGQPGFGPRGVPIGNLTSQWFANIVGNCLDQFVKHELRCERYIRYMDDWLLIGGDKGELWFWLDQIRRFLDQIGLVIHPKTRIFPIGVGVPFLGFRVWRDHRRLIRGNLVAGRRRLRRQLAQVASGQLAGQAAVDSLRSWFAHLEHADTYQLRRGLWWEAKPVLEEYL